MGTWELGSSLSTVAVVSAAHRDPIRAVRWVNAVVEELPASDARVQRNFAVVLRALASRIDVAVVDLARRLVTDPFARETLSMPGGAFAEEENMEEHRPEKLQRMDEEYAESDQRKHSNDTLSSTMVTVVETDEKCEGSQENFEQEKKQEEGMRDTLIEGGRLEALVGLEGEIAEELDSWAARGDAGRRIEPPKRATNTMKASTMPVAWASRLSSSQVMWSDDAVAVLIENLLTTGDEVGVRLGSALATHVITPRLVALEASASRELMGATVALSTRFPHTIVDIILPNTLDKLNVAIAEVLVRVSRECLQGAIALNALTTVSKRPWTEATVRLAEELFLRSAPSKEAMRLIVFAIERNAPLLPSSLRFAKVAMLVVNKMSPEDLQEHRVVLRRSLTQCTSFLAKSVLKKVN